MSAIRMTTKTLTLLCAVGIARLALAGGAPAELGEARAAMDRARAGDAASAERASALFQKLSDQDPSNPLYLAYQGSAWTIRGKLVASPLDKLAFAEKGLDLLDRALALLAPAPGRADSGATPAGLETRLVAASTFLALPDEFHRFEDGKAAVSAAVASPAFAHAPPPLAAQLQLQVAAVARKEGRSADEARALRAALALLPPGPMADRAHARLAEVAK